MSRKHHNRLVELKKSGFEIVKGDPDIRGWEVKNVDGKRIGVVDELILDTQKNKVRYMVVDLKKNALYLNSREVLIPIGLAELHRDDDDVILPTVQTTQLEHLPEYERDKLDHDYERKVCYTLGRSQEQHTHESSHEMDPEFYTHDYYNDDNLYRHRLHQRQQAMQESEYEKGLRLWEKRSEGGILPGPGSSSERSSGRVSEERHEKRTRREAMEPVRNQRQQPRNRKDRAGGIDNRVTRPGKTIEDRIRREGLRDADDNRTRE